MVKAVTAIYGREMIVDTETIQHGTTEVNGLVCQDSQFAVGQAFALFAAFLLARWF